MHNDRTRTVAAVCHDCGWTEPETDATDGANRLTQARAKRHAAAHQHRVTHTLTVVTEYAGGRAPKQPYRGRRG